MFKVQSIRLFAASAVASAIVGSSIADMVYDDENTMSAAPTQVEVKNIVDNRSTPTPIAATETVSTSPVIVETRKIQKTSEKSKERRGFQESVNNELVIQKLEDKRLKQEERLTSEINKKFTLEDDAAPAGTAAPVMREEAIIKPITEAPSASTQMSAAPRGDLAITRPAASDTIVNYQSSSQVSVATPPEKSGTENETSKSTVAVSPRAGIATISNSNYDFRNRYTLGVGLGMEASENIAVELGYAYSDYQVGFATASNYQAQYNPLTFKNNTFDLAMKLYLAGKDSKLRPFLGGGVGYAMGYVNYNQGSANVYQGYQNLSQDYQLNQVLGGLQAGLELKVASNVSVGVTYKFYKPLSTTETDDGLYNGGFYSPYGNGAFIDPNKQAVRGSLRDSTTQMFLVNATASF